MNRPPPDRYESACSGKTAFPSAQAAQRIASRSSPPRQAYRCQHCGAWHVAGKPKRKAGRMGPGWHAMHRRDDEPDE